MNIMILAMVLLALRFITVMFMIRVLSIQFPLLSAENDPQIKPLRYLLFIFATIITIGNIVPVTLDIFIFMNQEIISEALGEILPAYFMNNAVVFALSAACFWLIYKFTGLNTDEESKG